MHYQITFLAFFIFVSLVVSTPIEPEEMAEHGPKYVECVEKWMQSGEKLGKLFLIEYSKTVI